MFGMQSLVFAVCISVCVTHPASTYVDQCQTDGPCHCKFENGAEIDLTKLGLQNGKPLIEDQTSGRYVYSFNPCYPFSEGHTGDCDNVAGCQIDVMKDIYYPIGDADNPTFLYDGQKLIGNYSNTKPDGVTRVTIVDYICDMKAETPSFSLQGEIKERIYKFTITSKHSCPLFVPTPTPVPVTTHKPWCTTSYEDFTKKCYYGYDGHEEPVKVIIIHEWNGLCPVVEKADVAIHLLSDNASCHGVSNRCHLTQPFSVNNDVCKEP